MKNTLVFATIASFLPVLAQAGSTPASAPAHRPHMVLFIADDHTWLDCTPYGSTDVRTPNLDRLARESMRFELAFSASPTCAPSRSAIYTGLYPFRNGAHANHSLVRDNLRSMPHYLKDLGYRVVIAGKTHIGPREVFPFEYLDNSNIMPAGKSHILWTDLNTAAVDRLLATHNKSAPLCLIVCSHSPHVFWLPNDGYDPAAITLPPNFVDTKQTRDSRCRYYTDVNWMDKQVGEVRESLAKHGYADRTLFMFTADQGAQWPFAKWNLYDVGIHEPLIAHWPGHIRPGTTTRAIVSLVDLLPTMVEAGGGSPPTNIDGRSFLSVLLGRAEQHHQAVFASHTGDGKMNRAPMRCIRTDRYKYILNLAPQIEYTTHISRADDRESYWNSWLELAQTNTRAADIIHRYEHRPAEELYDLQNDPFELKNLAADPDQAELLTRLRDQLKQWRIQQGEDLNKVAMPEDARRGELKYAG